MPPSGEELLPPGDFCQISAPAGENRRRWLVPLHNRQVRWSSLRLYTPTTWRGHAFRAANRFWTSCGAVRVTHDIVRHEGRDWALGDLLSPMMPGLATAAAYFSPGGNRKVVLQLMNARGDVLGFAKYADDAHGRTLITREVALLPLLPTHTAPLPIISSPFANGWLTAQTALPGRPRALRSRSVLAAQQRLLERLVRPTETLPVANHPVIVALVARAGQHGAELDRAVSALDGQAWPAAFMHGDLSPWNMRYWNGDFAAIDWEYGVETGMAFLEAPHGLIEVAGVIRRTDPARARRAITEILRTQLLPAEYARHAASLASLSALNMLITWYAFPAPADDFSRWLAAFIAADH